MPDEKFKIAVVARMKHGALYEAIKKRGWTVKRTAEFLSIGYGSLCRIINLKQKPPFLFSLRANEATKRKTRRFTEKLMELTGMTVEDLFPEAVWTDEFLDKPKVFERTAEVSLQTLVGYAETLALPPAPDEELMKEEDDKEVLAVIEELSVPLRHTVNRVLFDGEKSAAVAKERGVSRQRISQAVREAKRRIREELDKRRRAEHLKYRC